LLEDREMFPKSGVMPRAVCKVSPHPCEEQTDSCEGRIT
jgi:hypothetical protein